MRQILEKTDDGNISYFPLYLGKRDIPGRLVLPASWGNSHDRRAQAVGDQPAAIDRLVVNRRQAHQGPVLRYVH